MYSYIRRITPECSARERYNNLTSSLSCHSKQPIKALNFKPLTLSVFFFALAHERIFFKTHRHESRCIRSGKYTVCTFQPWNFTCRGSEGVNQTTATKINVILLLMLLRWYVTVTKCVNVARCRAHGRVLFRMNIGGLDSRISLLVLHVWCFSW